MTCKDLKERILNSEEYISEQKRKEDEFNRDKNLKIWQDEIFSWFVGLPRGYYRMYGQKHIEKIGRFFKKERVYQNSWRIWVSGNEVKYAKFQYPPNRYDIEWIINNQEEVCKGIKYLG